MGNYARMAGSIEAYLAARSEVFASCSDALVVVDIVLPAVLGPAFFVSLCVLPDHDLGLPTGSGWGSGRRNLLSQGMLIVVRGRRAWSIRWGRWFIGC